MNNLVKIGKEGCKGCTYQTTANARIVCNYSLIEGHSRVFENGKRKNIPIGYCDCYLPVSEGKDKLEQYSKRMHRRSVVSLPKEDVYSARI